MQQRKRGDNVEDTQELVERIPAHADGYLSPTARGTSHDHATGLMKSSRWGILILRAAALWSSHTVDTVRMELEYQDWYRNVR